ncbi:heavy-metal-associated domain-containing protein [Shewanella violacea]|uniref:Uncharacterized protein n=1 Tax=Shewanella violacea (strain JCM 10179 / CIP 106290 / LMG 19151 / DSS12) TaxID=637905 RepID=D4ZB09_SHEVD|nr:heavy-metal-associated domain-containing protein [Shewanella violacea]BAJ03204.1 hypothetical protein SVI_3233 [Shewanella violacea DSS12]
MTMFLKLVFVSFLSGLLVINAAAQVSAESDQISRLTIKVRGIVCSFCAFGVEKNLSRLPFLDKTQFGQNGVLININTQEITLALLADKPVAYADIATAITKGGYDPISYHGVIEGVIHSRDGKLYLVDQGKQQVYHLPQTAELTHISGKRVQLDISLTSTQAKASNAEETSVSEYRVSHVYDSSEPKVHHSQSSISKLKPGRDL